MSQAGKLRRGLKWYNFRDINGVLPEDIALDTGKMCDVTVYLDSLEPKPTLEVKEVKEIPEVKITPKTNSKKKEAK